MLRVLADNSVVVSGLVWRGPASRVLEAARLAEVELVTSERLLDELRHALDGLRLG